MPTLNVRLAAIIFVVVLVVGGGVHLLHGFQVGRQAHALKEASERAENDKNLDNAIRLLRDYVTLTPADKRAELHLGVLCADARSLSNAYKYLEEGLRTENGTVPADEVRTARRKLVDVEIMTQRYGDAQAHLDILLDNAVAKNEERRAKHEPPQGDPELLDLYGQVLPYFGKDIQACDVLRDAITIAPQQIDPYLHLAIILRSRLSKPVEADKVVEDMKNANPHSVYALNRYAYYYWEQNRPEYFDEKVIKPSLEILKLVPDDSRALMNLGRCYFVKAQNETGDAAKADIDRAEKYFEDGVKAKKDDYAMYVMLSEALMQTRPDDAVAVLKRGIEATKGNADAAKGNRANLDLSWQLVNVLFALQRYDEVNTLVKELRDSGFPPLLISFIDAKMAIQQQDWPKAEGLLEDVIAKIDHNPNVRCQSYVLLAQCYKATGRDKLEEQALDEALKIDPNYYQARAMLAEFYVAHHKLEHARDLFTGPVPRALSETNLASQLQFEIMIQLQADKEKRDWKPVDDLLEKLIPAGKITRITSPRIAVLKAEVLLAKAREAEGEDGVSDASKAIKKQAEKRIEFAADILKQCTDKAPKNAEGWLARYRLAMHRASKEVDPEKKAAFWNEASGYIADAEKNLGDGFAVRLAHGSLAVHSKDPHVSDVLKKLGENADKWSDLEKSQLWAALATLSHEAGDLDLARAYCRRIADKEPKNIRIRFLLCDLQLHAYEKDGTADVEELDRLIADIERLGGQGPFWLYGRAIRALEQSKSKDPQLLVEALGDLKLAMEARSDWASPEVLSGKICELQDEPDQALEHYIRAIYFMNERDNDVIGRTVKLLVPRGRVDEAKQLFDYLEKQKSPLLDTMQKEFVFVKAFRGDIADAEKEIDKSVPADSIVAKDVTWQGEMYGILARRLKVVAQQQQADKASEAWRIDRAMLRMAQKSINVLLHAQMMDPQSDEVWIALARVLIDVGQPEKAAPFIGQMETALKGDRAPVTIGFCCELLAAAEAETVRHYQGIPNLAKMAEKAKEQEKFFRDKAQVKYETAVAAAPQNTHILRQTAGFYIRSGRPAAAESLLHKIISLDSPATITDTCWARRSMASILSARGDFDDLNSAMALIDQNLASKAATSEDKRIKVQFLINDPRKEKLKEAIAGMEELVKAPDATPDDNFNLAQLYLRNEDSAAFERQMQTVLGSSHVQPRHLVLYINWLLQRKSYADAEQLLQTLEKMTPDSFDTLRTRAEFLFARGDYQAARDKAMAYLDQQRGNRGQQIYDVGSLMEGFASRLTADGQPANAKLFAPKAEELFTALRSKNLLDDGDVIYAAYLARQKRVADALAVLEQSWDTPHLELLRYPASDIISSRAATPAQYEQLEKILDSAIAKSKGATNLLLLRSLVHEEQRRHDKAIEDYEQILVKEPQNFQALNNLALIIARSGGDLDKALALVNKSLTVRGPMAAVLDSRAEVYIARKEYDKALDDLNAAVADDGSPEEYFHLAWVLSLLDRKAEAAAAFEKAKEKHLDPATLDYHEAPWYEHLRDM